MRLADLIASIALSLFAVSVFIVALTHVGATLEHGGPWYKSAGLFPAILAVILFMCATRLFFQSRRMISPGVTLEGALKACRRECKRTLTVFALLAWLALYLFVMLPMFSYIPATAVFLVVLIAAKSRHFLLPAIVAIAIAAAQYGLFAKIAMIPLP